jgi:HK97 family phage prohead protease
VSTQNKEVRSFLNSGNIEARTSADGKKRLSGYAIVFNNASEDMGFIEYIKPSALNRTMKDIGEVLYLRDHKPEALLANTLAGTLKLSVDSHGLKFDATLPDTELANDTWQNVKLGNLRGNSFGFIVPPNGDSWSQGVDGKPVRYINDLLLLEVSTVSWPAYNATSIDARALSEIRSKLAKRDDDDSDDTSDICSVVGCQCDCHQYDDADNRSLLADIIRRRMIY